MVLRAFCLCFPMLGLPARAPCLAFSQCFMWVRASKLRSSRQPGKLCPVRQPLTALFQCLSPLIRHGSALLLSLVSSHSSIHLLLWEKWLPDPRKISVKVMSDWARLISRLVNSYCSAPGQMQVHGFQEPSNLSAGGRDDHPYARTWISN